mmetsp:Transcript_16531/g.31316  ORF Transcript_16531/g.31316 Transcript_16531/m.31316 type:complete len:423 (+) Transcript_16531:36-1304(+)
MMHQSRKRSREVHEIISNERTSAFFTTSPSSAWGAVESLGTLVDVLSNYKKCFCMSCKNTDASYSRDELIDIISRHFIFCNKFREALLGSNLAQSGLNEYIIAAVCHLCPYNCYLRAYSPARKWYSLRSNLFLHGNISPNKILNGWYCYLSENNIAHETEMVGLKPKVHFVAPNGEVFQSEESVMRALGCTQDMKYGSQSKYQTLEPFARTLQHRSLSLLVESEIIAGRSIHGIACNHTTSITYGESSCRFMSEKIVEVESRNKECGFISPFGLLEELFVDDPWRLLLSTILLNRTCREQVDFVMYQLLERYPTSQSMENGDVKVISGIIRSLGMHHRRTQTLIRFSREYNEMVSSFRSQHSIGINDIPFNLSRNNILGLYGCGIYAADAYEIFILGKYGNVTSSDHALRYFTEYKRSISRT